MSPSPSRASPWFAFLFHPREPGDLDRWQGSSLLRRFSETEEEFVDKALSGPPLMLGEFFVPPSPVRGELIAVPALPREMLSARGRRLVSDAARVAVERGARVLGLGALTSPATAAGAALLPDLPRGVTVTTGNALTAVVARQNVGEALRALRPEGTPRVAVVGATGSVGQAAAGLLAHDDVELILIGRSVARAKTLLGDLEGPGVALSGSLADARRADVILLLTSDESSHLEPDMFRGLRSDVVAIDVAQPPNVPAGKRARLRAMGVTVVPGGLVTIPGFVSTLDLGAPAGATFACLAETYLFAREGIPHPSVGAPTVELAQTLERVAARHGVQARTLGLAGTAPSLEHLVA